MSDDVNKIHQHLTCAFLLAKPYIMIQLYLFIYIENKRILCADEFQFSLQLCHETIFLLVPQ